MLDSVNKRLLSVLLDDNDPSKTEEPSYLVVELFIVLIQVFLVRKIIMTDCFVNNIYIYIIINDIAVTTVCSLLISQINPRPNVPQSGERRSVPIAKQAPGM